MCARAAQISRHYSDSDSALQTLLAQELEVSFNEMFFQEAYFDELSYGGLVLPTDGAEPWLPPSLRHLRLAGAALQRTCPPGLVAGLEALLETLMLVVVSKLPSGRLTALGCCLHWPAALLLLCSPRHPACPAAALPEDSSVKSVLDSLPALPTLRVLGIFLPGLFPSNSLMGLGPAGATVGTADLLIKASLPAIGRWLES